MEQTIKVMICDDSVEYCEGLHMYLDMRPDFTWVGAAHNTEDCLKMAAAIRPDLILLDIQMETNMSGISLLRRLMEQQPGQPVIMLTGHKDSEYVFLSIVNGAIGYVIKDIDLKELFDNIKQIYLDKAPKASEENGDIMKMFISEAGNMYRSQASLLHLIGYVVKLSGTEYDILRDIYNGMTYRQIAEKRVVEEGTIKTQAARIIKKFEAKSMKDIITALKDVRFFENF